MQLDRTNPAQFVKAKMQKPHRSIQKQKSSVLSLSSIFVAFVPAEPFERTDSRPKDALLIEQSVASFQVYTLTVAPSGLQGTLGKSPSELYNSETRTFKRSDILSYRQPHRIQHSLEQRSRTFLKQSSKDSKGKRSVATVCQPVC